MTKEELNKLIAKTKQDHPQSKVLKLKTADGFECYIRTPDRQVLLQYMKHSDKPDKAGNILIQNCVLTNKEQVMEIDKYWLGVQNKISEYIPTEEFEAIEVDAVKS